MQHNAPSSDNTLAIVALVISVLSACAAGAVVWQTWRYHPRPAWVVRYSPFFTENGQRAGTTFGFINRGSLEATDVRVHAGGVPGPRDNHAQLLGELDRIEPNQSIPVDIPKGLNNENGDLIDRFTITWRHHPRPERLHHKTYRLIDFEWTDYKWGPNKGRLGKPPRYREW